MLTFACFDWLVCYCLFFVFGLCFGNWCDCDLVVCLFISLLIWCFLVVFGCCLFIWKRCMRCVAFTFVGWIVVLPVLFRRLLVFVISNSVVNLVLGFVVWVCVSLVEYVCLFWYCYCCFVVCLPFAGCWAFAFGVLYLDAGCWWLLIVLFIRSVCYVTFVGIVSSVCMLFSCCFVCELFVIVIYLLVILFGYIVDILVCYDLLLILLLYDFVYYRLLFGLMRFCFGLYGCLWWWFNCYLWFCDLVVVGLLCLGYCVFVGCLRFAFDLMCCVALGCLRCTLACV